MFETLSKVEAENKNNFLKSKNTALEEKLRNAQNQLELDSFKQSQDIHSVNERVDSLFGYSNMLIDNVVTLRKGVLSNSEGIIQLEGKANAIEGVLSGVVNNLERNQYIEDEISSFINNMFSVIKDLSKQLSELTGKPFDEEEFNAAFEVESMVIERERISPAEMADQNGIPYAYHEAISCLLWEFEKTIEHLNNIDFSQSPPVQIKGESKYSEGIIFRAKNFKENFQDKISYEDFREYLISKDGEDASLTQKAVISCQRKGVVYGVLFSALEDINKKNIQKHSENIEFNDN